MLEQYHLSHSHVLECIQNNKEKQFKIKFSFSFKNTQLFIIIVATKPSEESNLKSSSTKILIDNIIFNSIITCHLQSSQLSTANGTLRLCYVTPSNTRQFLLARYHTIDLR